ncbi:hypothetical protein [Parapedobacter koreensis]|uniref:Uncharacterized protein n=1 Tax=Parapedobacter koreensis TaxID=332977 RepID=A0A1H7QB15_9SPHI|nr:hypothetical protein [Parapedobacter koreensis]SEL44675.1 hypothetical protein SAMN05421740_105252 [Parapedobacter koreensis]
MEIPTEIANIVADCGTRNLTFSEKRKLLLWYQQEMYSGIEIGLLAEKEKETGDRIFRKIMDYINRHPHS